MVHPLQFGSYRLPDTFYIAKWPMARSVPSAKLVRADGARTISGYLEGKTFGVRGSLVDGEEPIPTASGSLRRQLDGLRAALNSGPTTFQSDTDRYYRQAQVAGYEESYTDSLAGRVAEISFDVVCGDPFAYEFATQTITETLTTSGQTLALTAGGNAFALPSLAVTMNGSGTLAATLLNSTTGEGCTLTGHVENSETILLDSLAKRVMRSGDFVDRMALFDGLFPRLVPGANLLLLTWLSGGPGIGNITATWSNRWW